MAFDPRLHDEPDAVLLAQCQRGNGAAAAELYRRHATAVYRFVLMTTGSQAEAADVLQETFMLVLERTLGYDPARGSCSAYLCGIARHLLARRFDWRSESHAELEELAEAAGEGPALPLPEDALERAQAVARLGAAIRKLPPHYRDILILVELQEMSYTDAAAVAGIELGTVRSRLARARARLVELLRAPDAKNVEKPR
jgi:RNA polymerase sigma-70 factor (ECF subfamily)